MKKYVVLTVKKIYEDNKGDLERILEEMENVRDNMFYVEKNTGITLETNLIQIFLINEIRYIESMVKY